MIFKVKSGDEWLLFDGLRRVSFVRQHLNTAPRWNPKTLRWERLNESTGAHDAIEVTHEFGRTADPAKSCTAHFVQGIDQRGEVLTFVFARGYLLNDEGKTIEAMA